MILGCGVIYSKTRCRGVGCFEASCSKTDQKTWHCPHIAAAPLLEESGTFSTSRQ